MRRSSGGNQARLGDDGMNVKPQPRRSLEGPVECLGMIFENDKARRAYFLERLREKLADPEFRKIEGFPIGKDEDIVELSDPPYYTACPNPFLEDFIKLFGKPYDPDVPYTREPFATDVSEGRNDPIYNAHTYHTKVPYKAIMRYILYYTEPGDVVFDGFCGTGMTGLAAQLCGDRSSVESLGYQIQPDGRIFDGNGDQFSKLGHRFAILNDLSPAATFISYNYNTPVDADEFELEVNRILGEAEKECSWMYETLDNDHKTKGIINYTLWSDVFICPECLERVVLWDVAVDKKAGKVNKEFLCPNCSANLTKKGMDRLWETTFDKAIDQNVRQAKQVPVLINYTVGKRRFEKVPDANDLELIDTISNSDISYWFPIDHMPIGVNTEQPKASHGVTHVHQLYTKRNLYLEAAIWSRFLNIGVNCKKYIYLFSFTAAARYLTRLSKIGTENYFKGGGGPINAGVLGTLYLPSFSVESNVLRTMSIRLPKLGRVLRSFPEGRTSYISTQSADAFSRFSANTIDYVFVDPPFGGNLMYSELSFLWESWLRIFTNIEHEAIINKVQNKALEEYQKIMENSFKEFYRILKPGRWITVEFHNSKNSVWNAIQEALQRAGFVIADVRILDKQIGSFKQVTTGGAVKQDLIISSYKPNGGLEDRFRLEAGTEESVWDFLRAHLRQLPVFVQKDSSAEVIAERQDFLLFDRMVAFHLRRGATVPLSAAEFYAGLAQRFPERDGMYFLPEQAAEYDKKRMNVKEIIQLQLSITDESSAIQWIKQQLAKKPQTLQDLTPTFMKELAGWSKHEKLLELRELMEQNFIMYESDGEVPGPIHSYLSTTFKELRNLSKTDPALVAKAKNRWYIPDPRRASDLEKLREKALLNEFHLIAESKKRIKEFRIEAVRAGFKKCWDEGDHKTILEVAKKLPTSVVEEDSHLLMYTDLARMRQG